jgi:tRNA modification GTPase
MPAPPRDTIFALSSGRPPAAIAVVRISGSRAREALEKLAGRVPEPRRAALARLREPSTGEPIDEALALWFSGPNSETGEDTVELQVHGGRAVLSAVLAALGRLEGLRMAEPGEFSRRAFENGRLDLTAVEGLADLIGAETEAQRRQAYRQMKGLLGDKAESWRARLIEALALVEARIDFSDEADVPEDLVAPALAMAKSLRDEMAEALAGAARGERLREGLVVAIAGPPNAGKSTLLNRLARRDAAIVSPTPGTTRDVIEVHLDLDGYPVTLLDTAGIRDSDDPVEQEGVRRARARAAEADLALWVDDARTIDENRPCKPEQRLFGQQDGGFGGRPDGPECWIVRNKIDLAAPTNNEEQRIESNTSNIVFYISALTGRNVNLLLERLSRFARTFFGPEPGLIVRERHRRALESAISSLDGALAVPAGSEDLVAENLRQAAQALARLTGRIDVEDVLDAIFRDFCIGK